MEPKSPRALDLPPIVIAVLTLLLTATAAVGECPSADELMESQVNLTTSKLHKSSTIYLDRLYMPKAMLIVDLDPVKYISCGNLLDLISWTRLPAK